MKQNYDILIVGAGLSAATITSTLKHKYNICVIDILPHIGGLCHDSKSKNSYTQIYGPHIFHTSNNNLISFLSQYSELVPFSHRVEADISLNNKRIRVPFPYSMETIQAIGTELSKEDIIKIFFDPYSKKMWGKIYNDLPDFIRKRIPENINKTSNYFLGQKQFIPKYGYTNMMKNMLDGAEVILNADPHQWKSITANKIIYCGRIDLININKYKKILPYFTSDVIHKIDINNEKINVVNSCLYETPYIRKTFQKNFYDNSTSNIVTYEIPKKVTIKNHNPFYPYPTATNIKTYNYLKNKILQDYPNMHFIGRSGDYQYINMDTAIEKALKLCETL